MLKKTILTLLVFVMVVGLVLGAFGCFADSDSDTVETCAWCGKSLGSSYKKYDGRKFCSESCKGQYALKKAW